MQPVEELTHQYYHTALGVVIGIVIALVYSIFPSIWHCPSNPLLGEMVQLRQKRSRVAGQHEGFGQFEMKDHYGLEHQILNMEFDPPTMWMNVGFWKENPKSLPEACQALFEQVLKAAGLTPSRDGRFSILEVGCGCAETARFLRRQWSTSFDQYIGVTLNRCQAINAAKRLAADSEIDQSGCHSSQNHIYCANAADPSAWPESLRNTIDELSIQQKSATEVGSLWLLALDSLYHFAPDRKAILTYACRDINASLMATDIIIPSHISWLDRLKIRLVFFGLKVPRKNILTRDQYLRMLVGCGYKEDNITMIDITEHCFKGFDTFTQQRMELWEAMGGSKVITRAVRMMGWLMGWWARSRTVQEFIVIAKK